MFCHNCGAQLKDSAEFCSRCGTRVYDPDRPPVAPPAPPQENVAMGAVGAVAGALLGAAVIVMLNQMGTYAAFAGFLLAVAVVYGYDLLGKRRGTAGTVIVTLLLLCVPYLAHTLCWALMISASTDVTYPLLYGIALFYALLNDGHIDLAMYLLELLVLYGFVAMGAVLAFARSAARQKKLSGKM